MVKVLDETPAEQAEWILFLQPDTVIDDVAFTFPFEFYQARGPAPRRAADRPEQEGVAQRRRARRARTLSRWATAPSCWRATPRVRAAPAPARAGGAPCRAATDGAAGAPGIDMGVFLVRNSAFIRGLFAELARRAVRLPVPTKVRRCRLGCTRGGGLRLGRTARPGLTRAGGQDTAFYPDPLSVAMAGMVAESPDKFLEKLNFRSEICISCDWRRIDLLASTKVRAPPPWRPAARPRPPCGALC